MLIRRIDLLDERHNDVEARAQGAPVLAEDGGDGDRALIDGAQTGEDDEQDDDADDDDADDGS